MNLMKKCRYGLMIYNTSDIWVGRSLQKYGEFSESEVQVFRDLLKQGDVALDIGANIGCHSVAMSRLVGKSGTIHAFEPERTNFNTLCGNVSINNLMNVFCYQKAVGSQPGFISVPELDHEKTVNYGGLSLEPDYSGGLHYDVPLVTIDSLNLPRVNFIKIDIEGMEKFALEGAAATIEAHKPVLYVEDDRDEKREALIAYIKSLGYVIYRHQAPLYSPYNFYGDKEDVFITQAEGGISQIISMNLFCHHETVDCPVDVNKFAMKQVT